MLRLRRRLSPLRLAIRTVRSRGYLLERADGGGQVAPARSARPTRNGVRRISVGPSPRRRRSDPPHGGTPSPLDGAPALGRARPEERCADVRIPIVLLIWLVIGVIVAVNKDYAEAWRAQLATFVLAVFLWPIPALDGRWLTSWTTLACAGNSLEDLVRCRPLHRIVAHCRLP